MAAWCLDNPRRFRRVTRAPAVVLAVALFGGCAVNGGPPDSPRREATAATNPLLAVASANPSVTGLPTPTSTTASPAPSGTPAPAPTGEPREVSGRLASLFVSGFARPTIPADVWQADLAPLVTRDYAEALAVIDPASLPPERVTGAPEEDTETPTPDAAVWHVPTDLGGVQVTTVLVDGRWKVDSAMPVDDDHDHQ